MRGKDIFALYFETTKFTCLHYSYPLCFKAANLTPLLMTPTEETPKTLPRAKKQQQKSIKKSDTIPMPRLKTGESSSSSSSSTSSSSSPRGPSVIKTSVSLIDNNDEILYFKRENVNRCRPENDGFVTARSSLLLNDTSCQELVEEKEQKGQPVSPGEILREQKVVPRAPQDLDRLPVVGNSHSKVDHSQSRLAKSKKSGENNPTYREEHKLVSIVSKKSDQQRVLLEFNKEVNICGEKSLVTSSGKNLSLDITKEVLTKSEEKSFENTENVTESEEKLLENTEKVTESKEKSLNVTEKLTKSEENSLEITEQLTKSDEKSLEIAKELTESELEKSPENPSDSPQKFINSFQEESPKIKEKSLEEKSPNINDIQLLPEQQVIDEFTLKTDHTEAEVVTRKSPAFELQNNEGHSESFKGTQTASITASKLTSTEETICVEKNDEKPSKSLEITAEKLKKCEEKSLEKHQLDSTKSTEKLPQTASISASKLTSPQEIICDKNDEKNDEKITSKPLSDTNFDDHESNYSGTMNIPAPPPPPPPGFLLTTKKLEPEIKEKKVKKSAAEKALIKQLEALEDPCFVGFLKTQLNVAVKTCSSTDPQAGEQQV